MKKSTTPPFPLIAKIAIAMTFINSWVIFEETVVDRHGLWRYMPYYRVGLFCAWDAAVLAVTLLLLLVSVVRSRCRNGPAQSTTPPFPLIGIIAIAMTLLNTLVIFFVWPGVLTRREPDHIARMDLFNGTAPALSPPKTRRDDQRLTEWMRMPGGACTRFERDARATNARRFRRLEQQVDANRAREPVRRPF